jgi:hypothetical protein
VTEPTSYAAPPRQVSPLDRVVTVTLMVGLGLLVPVAGFLGLMTGMASDGCVASSCNSTAIGLGMAVSTSATLVFFLISLVWVIVRWVRGRSTWWVPLVAAVAAAVLWVVGLVITASGVS